MMTPLLVLTLAIGQLMGPMHITGPATWYGTGPGRGHAAAGPPLRHALGAGWRGTRVRVCRDHRCVVVRVDDWCSCPHGRTIDLSRSDFGSLAPLSRGVIMVTIVRAK